MSPIPRPGGGIIKRKFAGYKGRQPLKKPPAGETAATRSVAALEFLMSYGIFFKKQ